MARLRTFIAIDLGKTICDRLVSLQETLSRTVPDVKWVESANLHLTMLFLGDVGERELLNVCRAVSGCCKEFSPFSLSVETLGCFGNPRRPRTLWVGVGDGTDEVKTLHAALESVLLELGCYRREERKFTPHITLGRVKQEGSGDDLTTVLQRKADWQAGAVHVREVLVMSSQLTSQGPIYSILCRAPLQREVAS